MATKKKGGPQTIAGKAVASQNSTVHGLTSSRPSSLKEKEAVQAYVQELTYYYKPDSPLEKLQIERIAICKVKLDRLYEVEQVQLELTTQKFKNDPDQILDQIPAAKGIVRGMVKELIQYGELTLPCKLKDEELELICEEVVHFRKKILKESDLETYWPNLTTFIKSYDSIRVHHINSLTQRLELIAQRIRGLFNEQEQYRERFQELAELAIRLKEQLRPEPEPPSEHELELDRHLQERKEVYEAQRLKRNGPRPVQENPIDNKPLIDQEKLTIQLKLFPELLKYRNISRDVYQQYQSIKELMVRGVTLPQRESDLLMRYQTALDRRLSTAMGELLHLQSRRGVSSSR